MGSCGANRREFKDQSAIKGNLGQKNAFLVAKQGLMGIRPNKTNFGLSFGHFGRAKCEVEKGREEEEEEKEEEERYGNRVFIWKLGFCMEVFIWRLVVPFLGFR